MKWLFLAALLMFAPVARAAPDVSAQAVPRGHWTYDALKKLSSVRVNNVPLLEGAPKETLQWVPNSLTRYQVAVFMARIVEMLVEQPPLTAPLDLSAVRNLPPQSVTSAEPDFTPETLSDLIASLKREYDDESISLGVRFMSTEPPVPRLKANPPAVAAAPPQMPEYPVVPRGHWSYEALKKWGSVRINGKPLMTFPDNWGDTENTRLELAVALVRLIETSPASRDKIDSDDPNLTHPMLTDLINALRREFSDELGQLVKRDPSQNYRVPEGRVVKPPRLTITPSFLHRAGTAIYISHVENPVSPTFAEILARVAKRDAATGAITGVKRKADAPQRDGNPYIGQTLPAPDLNFSIAEANQGQNAIIVLSTGNGQNENVYERYILHIDNAMREELRLQKLLQESQKAK